MRLAKDTDHIRLLDQPRRVPARELHSRCVVPRPLFSYPTLQTEMMVKCCLDKGSSCTFVRWKKPFHFKWNKIKIIDTLYTFLGHLETEIRNKANCFKLTIASYTHTHAHTISSTNKKTCKQYGFYLNSTLGLGGANLNPLDLKFPWQKKKKWTFF